MTAALNRLLSQLHLHEQWLAWAYRSDPGDDRDAVRARFEHHPIWPSSDTLERR